jgi:hypothetical protein
LGWSLPTAGLHAEDFSQPDLHIFPVSGIIYVTNLLRPVDLVCCRSRSAINQRNIYAIHHHLTLIAYMEFMP